MGYLRSTRFVSVFLGSYLEDDFLLHHRDAGSQYQLERL